MFKVLSVAVVSFFLAAAYGDTFKVPALSGPVVDQAQILSASTRLGIEEVLREVAKRGKIQLQVLTVDNLGGLTIEEASIKVTDTWKLGTAKADNGVLFFIAKSEKKIRIEVGQGLEGDIPDAYAKRIVDDVVRPAFKNGDFNNGILLGVFQILQLADPAYVENSGIQRSRAIDERETYSTSKLILILIFYVIVSLLFGGFRRRRRGLFLGGGGWGSGGGFSGGGGWSSGGGGWSGGGGGFSGGGASGGW